MLSKPTYISVSSPETTTFQQVFGRVYNWFTDRNSSFIFFYHITDIMETSILNENMDFSRHILKGPNALSSFAPFAFLVDKFYRRRP